MVSKFKSCKSKIKVVKSKFRDVESNFEVLLHFIDELFPPVFYAGFYFLTIIKSSMLATARYTDFFYNKIFRVQIFDMKQFVKTFFKCRNLQTLVR